MANDRTNMVSLVDAGLWLGGKISNIVEIGDGFAELTENWGPDKSSNQYINMKSKSSTLKGYEFSATAEREHLNDDLQVIIDNGFKKFPTGKDCETFYYRYYKTDMTIADDGSMSGDCIKLPVIMAPSSTGGAGGDVLTSSVEISGNGDVVLGTITISKDGAISFVEKPKDSVNTDETNAEQGDGGDDTGTT